MRKIVFMILISISANSVLGQCEESQLFPFKHLSSKFSITKELLLSDNYYDLKETWDYVDDDQIRQAAMYVYANTHPCMDGNKNRLYFSFEDDKLYWTSVISVYGSGDFKKCINKYNQLVEYFAGKYEIYNTFRIFQRGKKECGEKIIFAKKKNNDNTQLIERISVSYEIRYEVLFHGADTEGIITDKIISFELDVNHLNADGTKGSMFTKE